MSSAELRFLRSPESTTAPDTVVIDPWGACDPLKERHPAQQKRYGAL